MKEFYKEIKTKNTFVKKDYTYVGSMYEKWWCDIERENNKKKDENH